MDRLKSPSSFSFDGNVGQAWKSWKKAFQFFITATETDEKSEKVKNLLTCIGQRGREIGSLPRTYHIELKPEIKPVITPNSTFNQTKTKTKGRELQRMETLGIIERVDTPTDWVNLMVVIERRMVNFVFSLILGL